MHNYDAIVVGGGLAGMLTALESATAAGTALVSYPFKLGEIDVVGVGARRHRGGGRR